MKFLNTNYNYFVEIQIWRMKLDDIGTTLFRFHYAHDSPFWKNMDISEEEKMKLEQNWKLYQTFFAFSGAYAPILGRGYYTVKIAHRDIYPYDSVHIFNFPTRNFKNLTVISRDFKNLTAISRDSKKFDESVLREIELVPDINFVVALYLFPKMKLFYMGTRLTYVLNSISEAFVWTDELKRSGEKKEYTFLPSKENENVPWYEKYIPPYQPYFFYVFTDKIENPYWKINDEDIIIPSDDPNDSESLFDVVQKIGRYSLKNIDTIVQTNSKPLYDIANKDTPAFVYKNKDYNWKIFLLFLFILLSILAVQLLFKKKNDKL